MNQILSVNNNTKKNGKKAKSSTHSILVVFAVILMIFGIGPFPKMGISGAAYATGIGQVISLLVYIIVYFARPIPVKVERKSLKPDFKLLKRLYNLYYILKYVLLTNINNLYHDEIKSVSLL